jgi:hypothetical protein
MKPLSLLVNERSYASRTNVIWMNLQGKKGITILALELYELLPSRISLPQPNRPILRLGSIRDSIWVIPQAANRAILTLATFQLLSSMKIKHTYLQVTTAGYEFVPAGMKWCPAFFSEMNWHFVRVNRGWGLHVKEGYLVTVLELSDIRYVKSCNWWYKRDVQSPQN